MATVHIAQMPEVLTLQWQRRPRLIAVAEAALTSRRITLPHRDSIGCEGLRYED